MSKLVIKMVYNPNSFPSYQQAKKFSEDKLPLQITKARMLHNKFNNNILPYKIAFWQKNQEGSLFLTTLGSMFFSPGLLFLCFSIIDEDLRAYLWVYFLSVVVGSVLLFLALKENPYDETGLGN